MQLCILSMFRVLASECWWEAWQPSPKVTRSYWMLVCWWWWFDCSFARLTAPVVQLSPPPPSSFASLNTDLPRFTWKMAVKTERERERERERFHIHRNTAHLCGKSWVCNQWWANSKNCFNDSICAINIRLEPMRFDLKIMRFAVKRFKLRQYYLLTEFSNTVQIRVTWLCLFTICFYFEHERAKMWTGY